MEYKIVIISYVDILGFRNFIEQNNDPKILYDILKQFKSWTKQNPEIAKLYEQKFLLFSDTAIRTTNILSSNNKKFPGGILFHELMDLIYIQLNLLNNGIFIRGSISINYLYQSSSFIFGPGLIHAYDLESKDAKFPRIIIDKTVMELIKETPLLRVEHHTAEDEEKYINELTKTYIDSKLFLNYLSVARSEANNEMEYFSLLQKHKNLIIQNLKKYKKSPKILMKYNWLRKYHNNIIKNEISAKTLKYYGFKKSQFIIN